MKDPAALTAKKCSCWQKSSCPLAEKCLSESLVYYAQVDRSDIDQTENYYGTCEKNFKECYKNDTAPFRNKSKEKVQNCQNMWCVARFGTICTI